MDDNVVNKEYGRKKAIAVSFIARNKKLLTYLGALTSLNNVEKNALKASKYKTITEAQQYIDLLEKGKESFEELVKAQKKMVDACEEYLQVATLAHDELEKKTAKEQREDYERTLNKTDDFLEKKEIKKASARAFIEAFTQVLNNIWHSAGARRFRI